MALSNHEVYCVSLIYVFEYLESETIKPTRYWHLHLSRTMWMITGCILTSKPYDTKTVGVARRYNHKLIYWINLLKGVSQVSLVLSTWVILSLSNPLCANWHRLWKRGKHTASNEGGEVIDVAKWVFLVKFFGSFQNWNFSNAELETTQKIQLAGVLPTG